MPKESKEKEVTPFAEAIDRIRKKYGNEAIQSLDDQITANVEAIPTGSIGLDYAIGIGGIPRGRITEIFGGEAGGKTTLCLHIMANAQKLKGNVAFIDTEHVFDAKYATAIGVDIPKLQVSQPESAEEALDIMETLVRSGDVTAIVLDSVAALIPQAEIDGEMGDSHMGLQARIIAQALRKLVSPVSKSNTAIIFTNQIRQLFQTSGWGPTETTPGGRSLKFHASVRLDVRRIAAVKKGDATTANKVRVRVAKNKVAPPFKFAEFEICFGKGIDKISEILDLGITTGLIEHGGPMYKFSEENKFKGEEAAKKFLEGNIDVQTKLVEEIYKRMEG